MRCKKGEDISVATIMMVFLTILFFIAAFYFVSRVSSSAFVYQQIYSKQIALILDNSRPNTIFEIDFEEGIKKAEKYHERKLTSLEKENLVQIKDNQVSVKLTNKGYSTLFFTDYNVTSSFNENKLVLIITPK